MYGARWCARCQFNYFPWKKEDARKDGSHRCDSKHIQRMKKALAKIKNHEKAIREHREAIARIKATYRLPQ